MKFHLHLSLYPSFTLSLTHTLSLILSLSLSLSLYPSFTLSLTHSHSHSIPLSHSLTHTHTHTHTLTHSFSLALSLTHAYTISLSMPLNGNAFVNAETVIYQTTISTFSLRLIFFNTPKNNIFLSTLSYTFCVPNLHDVITVERSYW